ncbi:putative beta-lysine N-acetyltransferase [Cytobacillus sp. Hm23]
MAVKKYFDHIELKERTFTAEVTLDYFNKRLKIDDYRGDVGSLLVVINKLIQTNSFTKGIVKVRNEHLHIFLQHGFMLEAVFQKMFNGSDVYCMCKYYDDSRYTSNNWIEEDKILTAVQKLEDSDLRPQLPDGYIVRKATHADANHLAKLYATVFEIYPTPLNDPNYITNIINNGTIFFVVEHQAEIVSAASAEINEKYNNAELTDCATLTQHRKFGLMKILLLQLEQELINNNIYCAYSIARALSYGMNAVLKQLGYSYTGRLKNNCYIFDKLEDMNVWVKDLSSN